MIQTSPFLIHLTSDRLFLAARNPFAQKIGLSMEPLLKKTKTRKMEEDGARSMKMEKNGGKLRRSVATYRNIIKSWLASPND